MSDEEIQIMSPKSVDELNAELDVELINADEKVQPPKEGQDHLTYIYKYYSADDTEEKFRAIEERKAFYLTSEARKIEMLKQELPQEDGTAGNIAQSNASSRMSANLQAQAQAEITEKNELAELQKQEAMTSSKVQIKQTKQNAATNSKDNSTNSKVNNRINLFLFSIQLLLSFLTHLRLYM